MKSDVHLNDVIITIITIIMQGHSERTEEPCVYRMVPGREVNQQADGLGRAVRKQCVWRTRDRTTQETELRRWWNLGDDFLARVPAPVAVDGGWLLLKHGASGSLRAGTYGTW